MQNLERSIYNGKKVCIAALHVDWICNWSKRHKTVSKKSDNMKIPGVKIVKYIVPFKKT